MLDGAWRRAKLQMIDARLAIDEVKMLARIKSEAVAAPTTEEAASAHGESGRDEESSGEGMDADGAAGAPASVAADRMYTTEVLERRFRLRHQVRVLDQLELWWRQAQVCAPANRSMQTAEPRPDVARTQDAAQSCRHLCDEIARCVASQDECPHTPYSPPRCRPSGLRRQPPGRAETIGSLRCEHVARCVRRCPFVTLQRGAHAGH